MNGLNINERISDTQELKKILGSASKEVREILNRALEGNEVSVSDGVILFEQRSMQAKANRDAIYTTADIMRSEANGEHVSFVVNRNINFTNVCYMGCRFCGFAKRKEDKNSEWLSPEDVASRAKEAWKRGATEVCIQGGLHPNMAGTYYRDIVLAIKSEVPLMHIHAFSPFEIWYGARKTKMNYRDFITDLKECGLNSMPGTAAEILDKEVRKKLTQNKLSAEEWIKIIRSAHYVGVPTTATIMYGHVDGPTHWSSHIGLLREIQRETGGFTELVPLSFVHSESPLYKNNPVEVRPGPTTEEVDLMHSISRIMLNGFINNIQVSWTKLGIKRAVQMLSRGVNDLGGTLMNESISRSAGSKHGQEITAFELCKVIRSMGRVPVRRNTIYETMDVFENHDPEELSPLISRKGNDPLSFLDMFPEVAK